MLKTTEIYIAPILALIGTILKKCEKFPDKFIPLALMPPGILLCVLLGGASPDAVICGILSACAAVCGNQIYKQLGGDENGSAG